jgi:GT2 family glycosyltransferase
MQVGIVIIGRNEGERLVRCLQSLPAGRPVAYVDSGSTDASVEHARAFGATVVTLDMSNPFTAARARNAGRDAMREKCGFIQFVDGDCVLARNWMNSAIRHLESKPDLAVVFGRRREQYPEASIFNWLCDVEWSVRPGPVRYFGGDALVRTAAFDAVGGYNSEMIAGEEPDLAIRIRAHGWNIECLDHEMTLHDAAISRFGQWWRRALRSGHAYAEIADRHPSSSMHDYKSRIRRSLFWGGMVPLALTAPILLGLLLWRTAPLIVTACMMLLVTVQIIRLAKRERRRWPGRQAITLAIFLTLAKPAQTLGILRFWWGRVGGRRSAIIEYKKAQAR